MHDCRGWVAGLRGAGASLLLIGLAVGAGCLRINDPTVQPRILSVEVTPATVTLRPGQAQIFRAAVRGDGPVPQLVSWSIVGDFVPTTAVQADGSLRVSIGAANVRAGTFRVRAASVVAGEVDAFADVSVPEGSLAVSPAGAEVALGGTLQLHADTNLGVPVSWSCTQGTIDSSGRYTAPAVASRTGRVVVTATAGPLEGTSVLTLRLPPPSLGGYAWSNSYEDVLVLSAQVPASGGQLRAVFRDALGQELEAPVAGFGPGEVAPPPGAVDGTLRLRLVLPEATPGESSAVPFTHRVRLRVRAGRSDLAVGESTRVKATVLRGDPAAAVTLATAAGSLAGDLLTAPAAPTGPFLLSACPPAGEGACSGQAITAVPFRVTPAPALAAAGGTLSLSAAAPHAPQFTLASGGGAVTAAGRFTAPTSLADSGATWLLASVGTSSLPVEVGLTGLTPGTVARVAEKFPPVATVGPWGVSADAVAGDSGRLYLSAGPRSFGRAGLPGAKDQRWIDSYDLADPLRPAWLGSVPSGMAQVPHTFAVRGQWLFSLDRYREGNGDWAEIVEIHDLSAPLPSLAARRVSRRAGGRATIDASYLYEPGAVDLAARTFTLDRYLLAEGPAALPERLVLPLPADQGAGFGDPMEARAADGRAYAAYPLGITGSYGLAVWDVAATHPSLVTSLQPSRTCHPANLSLDGPFLRACGLCWDTRRPFPAEVACPATVLASEGNTVVHADRGDLVRADASDPATGLRPGARVAGGSPRGLLRGGRYYYSPDATAGFSILDLGIDGGPRYLGSAPGTSPFVRPLGAFAGDVLYQAADGYLTAWNTAGAQPVQLWIDGSTNGVLDIAASGSRLVLATTGGLEVRTLRDPAAPDPPVLVAEGSVVQSLAVIGSIAWVGTDSDLVAVDLGAAGGPAEVGRLTLGGYVGRIEALGAGQLVVVTGTTGLSVVGSSDPASPRLVSTADVGLELLDLTVAGSLAYVSVGGTPEWAILDLADPAAPVVLSEMQAGVAGRIVLHGGLAWAWQDAWNAYDCRNPRWPRLVASFHAGTLHFDPERARALEFFSEGRLEVWDLSQPRNVILGAGKVPR